MKIKDQVKCTVADMLDIVIGAEILKWPPSCSGIMYQPERPETTTEDTD